LPSFVIDFENDFDIVTKIASRNIKKDGATTGRLHAQRLNSHFAGSMAMSRIDVHELRLYYKLLLIHKKFTVQLVPIVTARGS
jgi:hypothetical protein